MKERENNREREGGREGGGRLLRRRTESQLQLVFIIDNDTISWLFVHFKYPLSVLETVKMQRYGRNRRFIIYQAVLLKLDSFVVTVLLKYVLGYIRPLSILLQSKSCD